MKVCSSTGWANSEATDALVILAYSEGLSPTAEQVDKLLDNQLSLLISSGEISTKPGRVFSLPRPKGLNTELLIVCGGGNKADFSSAEAVRAAGSAAKRLADRVRTRVGVALDLDAKLTTYAVSAAMNGFVGQDLYRAEKNFRSPQELVIYTPHAESVTRGSVIGESMLLVRELVNQPPNYLTPDSFARRAQAECVGLGIEIEVWDEMRLRKERCNSLLGVSAGSTVPPRLLIMRYKGKRDDAPLALVGKGVTFDSGGLSIKPSDGMLTMKCDMAGAATVLGTMCAAARLNVEQPIVGLVGLVENMISGSAFKLGDVLTARSGTTIEIHNTDAEGRLVLADVLNVALEQKPVAIIDLATLTGACVVALGVDIAGLMGNAPQLQSDFQAAAVRAGELVWPLPMHRFFDEQINSQVADIKNMGDGRWGGAITAAKFLERFVGSTPWLHIDIAGPAFADKPKPYQDAGATAAMLKSLLEFIEK